MLLLFPIVAQNVPPLVAQFKSQDSLPSSVPTLPCSSHTMDCRTSQPATQKQAHFLIVTGEQQQEQSLQNPQKWKSVNTELRKPQASFGQATPSLSQDSGASETHQSVPTLPGDSISPEVQGQQQRHTQQRLIKFRYPESPPWEFQEQMQPQGKFPEEYPSRTRDRAEHSQPSLVMGKSSKVVRKVRGRPYIRFCEVPAEVKREKSPDEDPGQNLKRSPGDLPRGSRLSSQEVLQDAQGETERPTTRPWKCDSDSFLFSSPDENHFQKTLKAHLGNKLGKVTEDRVPVSIRQSWLAASHAAPRPDTCLSPRYVASREGPGSYVNTSQELRFLPQSTWQRLETRLARGRVRPRWGPQLQTLKLRCVQLGEPQPLHLSWSTIPFSVNCGSGTSLRTKVAALLEDAPQKAPGQEGLTKSIPTVQTPLSTPSPAFNKVQGTLRRTPASSTGQWARWSSQPLTGSLKGRTEQRESDHRDWEKWFRTMSKSSTSQEWATGTERE
ncbi:spermatogenesis-associated protein 31E1-like [Tupaia chinensis]|uniref:spermatogenesis-associated protein 31E1-like n=1 Tax=Tupaia chinensis TaxID=246437 RepID=UPI00070456BC|nr:spermatogenesis-associated protein 31E1-like [Tupaia chinensis]